MSTFYFLYPWASAIVTIRFFGSILPIGYPFYYKHNVKNSYAQSKMVVIFLNHHNMWFLTSRFPSKRSLSCIYFKLWLSEIYRFGTLCCFQNIISYIISTNKGIVDVLSSFVPIPLSSLTLVSNLHKSLLSAFHPRPIPIVVVLIQAPIILF